MNFVPRLHFAHLPTPIEELPRLSEKLGGPRLFIKRDDQTGLAFGGNKTRKLEFLVAEAKEYGARTLISGGAIQSNHCRQTAAAAARYGFECTLVLHREMPKHMSGNILRGERVGGTSSKGLNGKDRDRVLEETFNQASAEGKKPYRVPYGGSTP